MLPNLDENIQDIIKGCQKRDRSSQNALYRMFYSYGMSICIRYSDDETEAIAILNDGFLRVFRSIHRFDLKRPFKPWFRKIVVNSAINFVKQQKRFKMEINLSEAEHIPAEEHILSMISYQELIGMVQSLSTAYRTVFNMYVIDGFKHQEIAETLGISVGTSKSNLTRARTKLKELIQAKLNSTYVR